MCIPEYCTKFPEELKTDEDIKEHFPLEVKTQSYLFDAPTPKDARGRTVTLNVSGQIMFLIFYNVM